MTNFFKKSRKTYLGLFWVLLAQIWTKINCPEKKGCLILNIPIIYHHAKNQNKLMTDS